MDFVDVKVVDIHLIAFLDEGGAGSKIESVRRRRFRGLPRVEISVHRFEIGALTDYFVVDVIIFAFVTLPKGAERKQFFL